MTDDLLCDICSDGRLHLTSEERSLVYKGKSATYISTFYECDYCGIITKTPEQDKQPLIDIEIIRNRILYDELQNPHKQ